jgi:hypothetical protein
LDVSLASFPLVFSPAFSPAIQCLCARNRNLENYFFKEPDESSSPFHSGSSDEISNSGASSFATANFAVDGAAS